MNHLFNNSVYLETQTYQSDLKLETLQAEFLNHFPYFALERMSFLMVSIIIAYPWIFNHLINSLTNCYFQGMFPDTPQEFADVLKGVYGYSLAPFGRELPTSSSISTFIRRGFKLII